MIGSVTLAILAQSVIFHPEKPQTRTLAVAMLRALNCWRLLHGEPSPVTYIHDRAWGGPR